MTGSKPSADKPLTQPGDGRLPYAGHMVSAAVLLIPFVSLGTVPWLTGPFVLLTAGALLLQLHSGCQRGNLPAPDGFLWIPMVMALGLSALHLFLTPVPYSSVLFLAQLSVALAFYYLMVFAGPGVRPLTAVLLWTAVLVPWVTVKVLFLGSTPPVGPFKNPNYSATVLLVCLAMILGSLLDPLLKKISARSLHAASLLCSVALMLIGSRSAGLGMILLWIAFMVFKKGNSRWLALVVIAMIVLVPNTVRHRVTEGYKDDPHAFSRLQIWEGALKMGADHPIIGVGPFLYNEYGPRYAFPIDELPVRYGRVARKPHNEYIKSWAEGGAAGAAILGLFLIAVARCTLRAVQQSRAGPALAMGMVLFQSLFHDITEVFALWLLLAWCLAHLTPGTDRCQEDRLNARRIPAVLAGVLILCFSLWLTADLASRSFWLKGQALAEREPARARDLLATATVINPLLPGAARDLGRVEFMISRQDSVQGVDFDRIMETLKRARRLNRLDTVPLRLEAALYIAGAREGLIKPSEGLSRAAARFREALFIEPHNALIMLSLSEVMWDLNQRGQATDILDMAIATEPNYLQAHRARIARLAKLDPERVKWAEGELEKAKARSSGYKPLSDYEGVILR